MKNQPSFVKKGDPVKASEYNRIVESVRKLDIPLTTVNSIKNGRSRPFDVIDTKFEDEVWYVKLKAGYIQDGLSLHYIFYKDNDNNHWPLGGVKMIDDAKTPLEQLEYAYPWIQVYPEYTLCVNLKTHKLQWLPDLDVNAECIGICKFRLTEENLFITNLNPSNVVKSDNHPLKVNIWPTTATPLDEDITDCKVTVTSGYVFNIKTYSGEQAIDKKVPDNGADPAIKLDAEEPPVFEGVNPDDVVYLYCTVDEKGRFYEEPKIQILDDPDRTSVHYQPEPVASNGEMYYPLARIKELTFSNEPLGEMKIFVAEQLITGDVTLIHDLVTLKNVGEKREVFKEFKTDVSEYKFRTLEQLEGTNSYELIKKEPTDPTEAGNKETIEWKYLTPKASSPQIQLENIDDNKGIRIKGNNYTESFAGLVKALSVNDGLVTTFQEAEGWSGEIQFDFVDNVNPSNDTYLFLTIENGLITVVNENGVNVPDAGTAAFSTNNSA